jgi:hypothetical protein
LAADSHVVGASENRKMLYMLPVFTIHLRGN